MPDDVPFDVWNGEDLLTEEIIEPDAAEETAMHVEPDADGASGSWSDLTEQPEPEVIDDRPVSYFADEQPESSANGRDTPVDGADDGKPVDLDRLLERQHYTFPR